MTDTTLMAWGGMGVMVAALLLYLASPNQRMLLRPLPRRTVGWTGTAFLVAAIAVLLASAGPATALFIAFTLAMSFWSVVPLAVAWWRRPRGNTQ